MIEKNQKYNLNFYEEAFEKRNVKTSVIPDLTEQFKYLKDPKITTGFLKEPHHKFY
jgi:hypothetical protein